MGTFLQVFSGISTCPLQIHISCSQTSLSHHQWCSLRNLQGWTWKVQVPTWDTEARKILFPSVHWQHNSSKLEKPIQLPTKYLELPRNWPPLMICHISFLMVILIISMLLINVWLSLLGWKEDTDVRNMIKICNKKTRFYCSTCSHKNKKFYYCHSFSSINSEIRTCFLEYQHSMSQCFSWFFCLSLFHPLIYLLNPFCDFSSCSIHHHLVLFLLTVLMHMMTDQSDR